jgi:hypothetical protein
MSDRIPFFLGLPQSFHGKLTFYPPTVLQVYAEKDFNKFRQVLTLSQEDIDDIFTGAAKGDYKEYTKSIPTPIEFLLGNCYNNVAYKAIVENAFKFFFRTEISFLYEKKQIIIGKLTDLIKNVKSIDEIKVINESEFFDFQNFVRVGLGEKAVEAPDPKENPKIKKMKAKARYRDHIKAKSDKGISMEDCIIAICCMGIGITPLNVGEISYTAIPLIFSTYQAKEKYSVDLDTILAGADPKKVKPEYWIKKN